MNIILQNYKNLIEKILKDTILNNMLIIIVSAQLMCTLLKI